jgi:hypothetical protein
MRIDVETKLLEERMTVVKVTTSLQEVLKIFSRSAHGEGKK